MISLMIILPLVALALITVFFLDPELYEVEAARPWQHGLILALAVWGALLTMLTEGLSLFHAITQVGVAAGWTLISLAVLIAGLRRGALGRGWQVLRDIRLPRSAWELGLLIGFVAIGATLLVVALVAPVNNVDALQYHVPRVLHWIQDRSLSHYPVVYQSQNARPVWAEITILNLRILWGNDRPDHLVQWMSMVYSILLVAGITRLIGGGHKAQWLGSAFAISVPMGVLQADTAQNDYVATLWSLALAYFVVMALKRRLTRAETAGLGLALGLGLLSKGTVLMFASPLVLWFLLARWRQSGLVAATKDGAVIAVAVVALNAGLWVRNTLTYGGPYGAEIPIHIPGLSTEPGSILAPVSHDSSGFSSISMASLTNDGRGLWLGSTNALVASSLGSSPVSERDMIGIDPSRVSDELAGQLAKIAQMIGMNFVTPVKAINDFYFSVLSRFPGVFTEQYIGMLRVTAWNYDMTAGNPFHMLLIAAALFAFLAWRDLENRGLALGFAACSIVGFGLISFGGCSDLAYCIRYQLPFFFLAAPLVAVVFATDRLKLSRPLSVVLVAYAVPYILFSYMRPVIGIPPWPTRVGSVFTTPREELVFALSPGIMDEYSILADRIESNSCGEVGLRLNRDDLEYTFWWLLEAPQSGIQLRYVQAPKVVRKLIDPSYKPCAVICTQCGDNTAYQALPLDIDAGHVRLFMAP